MLLFGILSVPTANASYNRALDLYHEYENSDDDSINLDISNIILYSSLRFEEEEEFMNGIMSLFQDEIIYSFIDQQMYKEFTDYESYMLNNLIQYDLIEGTRTILIKGEGISRIQFERYLDLLEDTIKNQSELLLGEKISITQGEIVDVVSAVDEEIDEDTENEVAIRKPTPEKNYFRVIITSSIMGAIVAIFMILAMDVIKKSKNQTE